MGQGSGVALSCGVGPRYGSDPALLWLWHRLTAIALIRPLAWEPPYMPCVALKRQKKKKKKRERERERENLKECPWLGAQTTDQSNRRLSSVLSR